MQVSIDIFIRICIYNELNAINFITYLKVSNLFSFNFEIFIGKQYIWSLNL